VGAGSETIYRGYIVARKDDRRVQSMSKRFAQDSGNGDAGKPKNRFETVPTTQKRPYKTMLPLNKSRNQPVGQCDPYLPSAFKKKKFPVRRGE